MPLYQPGDYIKVEFKDDGTGESEWMWCLGPTPAHTRRAQDVQVARSLF